MNQNKTFRIVFYILLASLGAGIMYLFLKNRSDKELQEWKDKYKFEIIQRDSLTKINDSLYTRVVNDTKTIKDLEELNDSLNLELGKPSQIIVVEVGSEEESAAPEEVNVTDSIISIVDTYPNEGPLFITYKADANLLDSTAVGTFTLEKFNIALGIEQRENGLYYVNTKLPEFMNLTEVLVNSLPIQYDQPKDKFGFLTGAMLGYDYDNNQTFLGLSAGIRINKVQLEVIGGTNNTLATGFKIEL